MVATPEEVLRRYPRAVLSHESAARALGIELVEDDGTRRFTVPRNHSRPREDGWDCRRRDVLSGVLPSGARVTPAGPTVLDLAAVLPVDRAVAAGDSALRKKLVTLAVVIDLAQARRGRGRTEGLALVGLLDPKVGSVLESLFRVLVVTAGIRPPLTQYSVVDHGQEIGRFDFAWVAERLIVELDGFAFHSSREQYRQDRHRMNELERLGWRVLRFTWEDVMRRPEHIVALVRHCLTLAA